MWERALCKYACHVHGSSLGALAALLPVLTRYKPDAESDEGGVSDVGRPLELVAGSTIDDLAAGLGSLGLQGTLPAALLRVDMMVMLHAGDAVSLPAFRAPRVVRLALCRFPQKLNACAEQGAALRRADAASHGRTAPICLTSMLCVALLLRDTDPRRLRPWPSAPQLAELLDAWLAVLPDLSSLPAAAGGNLQAAAVQGQFMQQVVRHAVAWRQRGDGCEMLRTAGAMPLLASVALVRGACSLSRCCSALYKALAPCTHTHPHAAAVHLEARPASWEGVPCECCRQGMLLYMQRCQSCCSACVLC